MKDPKAYCFVAGTLIVTALGLASIEDIRPGDYVYAENTETGEQAYMPVLETFSHEVSETYTVTIEGEPIETTSGHPFYVVEEGWVGADELETLDEVELADGGSGTVDSVEKNELDEPVTVYNFAVMDYHTYYVGENGALVHNKCNSDVDVPNAGGSGGQALPDGSVPTDYYVSPRGDAIPASRTEFDYNLSLLDENNGKFIGEASNGPVRIRVEDAHLPTTGYSGPLNNDHLIDHIHIEHRQNGFTGAWGRGDENKISLPQSWFR